MTTPIDVLFIDLDDTIYPADSGIWQAISDRINRYMVERVGLTQRQAETKREQYLDTFGTSLTGLIQEHDVHPEDYLQFVHDLPIEDYLAPAPAVRHALESLPQTKHVFTNASHAHASRVLRALGISDCFQSIVGIEALGLMNKPHPDAYTKALELTGDPAPRRCALVDDRVANLEPAAELGMVTIFVGSAPDQSEFVDHTLQNILDLPRVIGEAAFLGSDRG